MGTSSSSTSTGSYGTTFFYNNSNYKAHLNHLRECNKIIMVGLDAAGKTTLLYKLVSSNYYDNIITVIPTIGWNVESLKYNVDSIKNRKYCINNNNSFISNLKNKFLNNSQKISEFEIICWDLSSKDKIHPLWRHFYKNVLGLIFVIDSNDFDRLKPNNEYNAQSEFDKILRESELNNIPLLVFCNKQDLSNALSVNKIIELLDYEPFKIEWNVFKNKCNLKKYLIEDGIIKIIYDYLPGKYKIKDENDKNKYNRKIYYSACCATTMDGVYEGLEWLINTIQNEI